MEQFLLFIIIGIISLVFNRKKTQPREEKRGPLLGHPSTQQTQKSEDRHQEWSAPVERPSFPIDDFKEAKNFQEAAEILLTKAKPKVQAKKAEAEVQMEALKKEAEQYRTKAREIRVEASSPSILNKEEKLPFQANDILKGIVMAEVLGPPRSKKLYRRL